MDPLFHDLTRRRFFQAAGLSLGSMALAALAKNGASQEVPFHPALAGSPHHPPRAKRLIYLHMNGAPSQLDLLDYKPGLEKYRGLDLPGSVRGQQRLTTLTSGQAALPVAPSNFKFAQHGKSGTWMSELLPHLGSVADEITVLKSLHTNAINHDPACLSLLTGNEQAGKPSLGAWLTYGLGSVNNDLPAFVVLTPKWASQGNDQALSQHYWGSEFLPARCGGTVFRSSGAPVLYLDNPPGVARDDRQAMLRTLEALNRQAHERFRDPQILERIKQHEMAFRMQASVPDLADLSGESKATLDLYGPGANQPGTFAASALLARRLIERGVRVVQIFHRGWDQHWNLNQNLPAQCRDVDQACAGLLKDLKARSLLEDTLVVWGGEFGRTVFSEVMQSPEVYGRDHHPRNFCMWMAGGGVKGGLSYGESDDFSYNVVKDPVHVRDLNATLLHLMGLDHQRLVYPHEGLDQRLTGVEAEARVIKGILA